MCHQPRSHTSFPTRRSSDLLPQIRDLASKTRELFFHSREPIGVIAVAVRHRRRHRLDVLDLTDRKSTRLNSSHVENSYAVFCLKKNTARAQLRQIPAGMDQD